MKNTKIITVSAAALVALVAVSGIAFGTFASTETNEASSLSRPFFQQNLSTEQKAEREARHEERVSEREERRAAMNTAIESGYDAWQEAVKEHRGEDAEVLGVINRDNFSRFSEAHDKIQSGREILEELGVDRGEMRGFGHGMKHGMGCLDN